MANMEALWVSSRVNPGKRIVASDQAHYTHRRISKILKIPYSPVTSDAAGRMDMAALKGLLDTGQIGTVVATLGTTGIGTTDPLPEILSLARSYDVRVHVDAAYGGYFTLVGNLPEETRAAFDAVVEADSVVIDPHKHGLQPYGCGCVLFRDPDVGGYYKHDSPYTYFTSSELHLGEISLECSRAGAAAVALWATQKLLPLTRDGAFAMDLQKCRNAANGLFARLVADERFLTILPPELDIVLWAPTGDTATEISDRSQKMFNAAAEQGLHLALVSLPEKLLASDRPDMTFGQQNVTCLRSCLMKPEHDDWLDRIWGILSDVA